MKKKRVCRISAMVTLLFLLLVNHAKSENNPAYGTGHYVVTVNENNTTAPDTALPQNKWHFLLEPYLMLASIKGTVGLGNLPDAEVDESVSDIFDKLQFAAMLYAEFYNNHWAITSDLIYMKLGADIKGDVIIQSGDVEIKQLSWELAVMRKLLPWLEAGVGMQLTSIKMELDMNINTLNGPSHRNNSFTKTWADPTVLARVKFPLGDRWLLQGRGNIGGFGVGSEFAWQFQGYVGYRFSRTFILSAGYRVMGVDYENGSDEDRFLFDINTFGPVLRFGFNF